MSSTILGFDFGKRYIGIAVGQPITRTAQPLTQINSIDWTALDKLIQEWQPGQFIVGLPLNMDETESPLSKAARQFANQLTKKYQKPVSMIDERLSTREAKERLQEQGVRVTTKAQLNSLAAQIIIETWFSTQSP